jgi:hypothetical protein
MDSTERRRKGNALAARMAGLPPRPDRAPRGLSPLAQLVMDSNDPALAELLEDVLDNEATILAQATLDALNMRAIERRVARG